MGTEGVDPIHRTPPFHGSHGRVLTRVVCHRRLDDGSDTGGGLVR